MRKNVFILHKIGTHLEMLVPRRKGQLLKLLILVPLSLLLATSIYYQFYYEQTRPLPQANSISAALVYNVLDEATQEDTQLSNNSLEMGALQQVGREQNMLASNNGDSYLRKRKVNPSQMINNDVNNNNNNNNDINYDRQTNYKLRDRLSSFRRKQQQIGRFKEQKLPEENALKSSFEENQRQPDDFVFDSRDNQQLALDKQLKQTLSGIIDPRVASVDSSQQNGSDINNNNNNDDIAVESSNETSESQSSDEEKLLRDEEADAQDAAVIPPPADPSGPGELGRPVVLKNLTKEQQNLVNVGWENNAFNQYISDIISVNRTLPDVRDPSCKNLKYPNIRQLPQTSVIICFHNEAWSVLLRTVHSIINRSPRHLIKEIILVDDFSNKAHLGQQLEDYVRPLKIVKVVRATKREGLIRARLLGARASTAPVLTFLDSHCECAEGWIEPLLSRIHEDNTAVVCPVIDVISDKTFEYHYKGDASAISVGGFDWNLQFNWHAVPDREKKRRKHPYDPLRSPTMAGGLFSIDKAFFERLGTYDSGFDIWGGENLELSFKTWMCGGTLEILPCSHVGHVFRSRSPYKWRTGVNVLKRNSVRLAEVWMDDYKKYYYDRIGHDLGDYGNITERLELRKKLNCKPFSYFVKEIYPELFIPGEAVAYGEVRNEAEGKIKMCLDSSARKSDYHKPLGVYPCHGSGGNQYWLLSRDGEIRRDEACVDYAGHDVVLFPCHGSGGNQMWIYEKDTMQVRHSTSGRCMELARDRIKIQMSDCDPAKDAQKWTFQHYNATLAAVHT